MQNINFDKLGPNEAGKALYTQHMSNFNEATQNNIQSHIDLIGTYLKDHAESLKAILQEELHLSIPADDLATATRPGAEERTTPTLGS